MRSRPHSMRPLLISIDDFIDAISAIGAALLLLSVIVAPWRHTARKTDHSEPPDALVRWQFA